ncbi:hypothetical protein HDU79_003137 [Rhizoclosmatium sp. JEL0117]|nr:hypothetical protein HDU79_003137 [Rhizoclosmatium sp. JEL0117]
MSQVEQTIHPPPEESESENDEQEEPAATSSEAPKKARKRNRKKKSAAQTEGTQPLKPPPQASRVWVDDPNWVAKVIPAGWNDEPETTQQPQQPPIPGNWDDTPIKHLLQEAIQREEWIKQQQQQSFANIPLQQPPSSSSSTTSSKKAAFIPTKPAPTSWDAPIQGVQFLSEGDNQYMAPQQSTPSSSTPTSKIPGKAWRGLKLDATQVETARAKLEELD